MVKFVNHDSYPTMKACDDFTRCSDGARAFHQCEPHNVKTLLVSKYADFVKQQGLRYPRFFDQARRDGWHGLALYESLRGLLHSVPEADRDEILGDYVAHLYGIDAAIVAHLEIRKALRDLVFQDECADVVGAYHRRLVNLYYHEVRFGRTDVAQFFHENAIVQLYNVDEADAIDYIDSCLTDALWRQLNIQHGWFEEQVRSAETNFASKTTILNKAKQRRYPFEEKLPRCRPRV
jgi:hypothetical protein